MITIPLRGEDLARVRLALSPLWETVWSFCVLSSPDEHATHLPWVLGTRRALSGADLESLAALMCVRGHAPDFLSPPPAAALPDFGDELDLLAATPPEVVREEVARFVWEEKELFRRLRPDQERALWRYVEDPAGSLECLVEAVDRYHELAIAPHWPRMRTLLEGDAFERARTLAFDGAEALFGDLGKGVRYKGGAVELDKPYVGVVEPDGRGLTLVPCVFSGPGVLVTTRPRWRPTLAYAPRGVAKLWASTAPAGDALKAALSSGRASVLKSLLVPQTTTGLARQLGLSPGTVSGHLRRLRAAGLVGEPRREGRRVYYRLSRTGESLLGLFGEVGDLPEGSRVTAGRLT